MMPENRLSTELVYAPILLPVPKEPSALESNSFGGVALNNPTQGLAVKVWTCTVEKFELPLMDIVNLEAPDVSATPILSDYSISWVSLAFDQNMRPFIAYVSQGQAKFYWYDSSIEQPVTTTMDSGVGIPAATLDDTRESQLNSSDILLLYVRDGNLYQRRQRDRYEDEMLLYPDINGVIVAPQMESVSMGINGRLQIKVRGNFYGG